VILVDNKNDNLEKNISFVVALVSIFPAGKIPVKKYPKI
jgi:hypothetical protein